MGTFFLIFESVLVYVLVLFYTSFGAGLKRPWSVDRQIRDPVRLYLDMASASSRHQCRDLPIRMPISAYFCLEKPMQAHETQMPIKLEMCSRERA
jgi:hypothetical protein